MVCAKIEVKVAGTTFNNRQGKLWNLRKNEKDAYVMLRREINNEHDKNAIAVIAVTGKTHAKIGYVPANVALWLAPKLDAHQFVRVYRPDSKQFVTGGTKNCKNLGCTIKIVYDIEKPVMQVAPAMALAEE